LTEPRIGVVGVHGGWSSESLADKVEDHTGFRLLVDLTEVSFHSTEQAVMYRDVNLCELDALIIKKAGREYSPHMLDALELLRYVEDAGVPVFSKPSRIARLINRASCTLLLRQGGIPLPPTVITPDINEAVAAVMSFGSAVLKPLYSTKARGMRLLTGESEAAVRHAVTEFHSEGNPMLYVQKKLDINGRDLGIAFLGGEYVGTYARVAGADAWNTTIHAGGHYEAHEASAEARRLAHRAQALFGLDFTSVDVAETSTGPVVFEVSAFGGYRGLKEALGLDAGEKVVRHVLAHLAKKGGQRV
jgi:tetrahydromethanopterin:alpha-L-glutamate ligase